MRSQNFQLMVRRRRFGVGMRSIFSVRYSEDLVVLICLDLRFILLSEESWLVSVGTFFLEDAYGNRRWLNNGVERWSKMRCVSYI
jgi:hypothetical protein